jgi:hypothetical protein
VIESKPKRKRRREVCKEWWGLETMDLSPGFCSSSSGRMLKMLCVETAVFLQTATCQKAVEEIRVKVRDTGKNSIF